MSDTKEPAATTVSVDEYNKVLARAQRFEAQLVDTEKKFEPFKKVNLEKLQADADAYEQTRKQGAITDPKQLEDWQKGKEAEIRQSVANELQDYQSKLSKALELKNEYQVVNTVMGIAKEEGLFYEAAEDDVKARVRAALAVDDEGNIYVKGEDGKPRFGANPSKLMTPQEYLRELADARPHWVKDQSRSGAKQEGTKVAVKGVPNITSLDDLNRGGRGKELLGQLTHEQKRELLRNVKI